MVVLSEANQGVLELALTTTAAVLVASSLHIYIENRSVPLA